MDYISKSNLYLKKIKTRMQVLLIPTSHFFCKVIFSILDIAKKSLNYTNQSLNRRNTKNKNDKHIVKRQLIFKVIVYKLKN